MRRLSFSLVVCVASVLTGASARASCGVGACPGDCNGVAGVQIDEIVTCVGIGLELLPADTCGSCDANFDGEVTIDELVSEVNTGLGIGGCFVDCFCGDGVVETGESCDDGNPFGGDGCVLNCTEESVRQGTLDAKRSTSVWQTAVIPILLNLSGSVDLRTGEADGAGFVENGPYPDLGPGDIPVTIKTTDVKLDQISVPGLVCACIRGVSAEPFGPGNAGVGVIGCGPDGLTDIDCLTMRDHDAGNGRGLPNDPGCGGIVGLPGGLTSSSCLEGTGAGCSTPDHEHLGTCNGPLMIEFSGGQAPRGSARIVTNLSFSLLSDSGNLRGDAHVGAVSAASLTTAPTVSRALRTTR